MRTHFVREGSERSKKVHQEGGGGRQTEESTRKCDTLSLYIVCYSTGGKASKAKAKREPKSKEVLCVSMWRQQLAIVVI